MSFLFWLDDNLLTIFAGIFGAVFASFACVVAERVPRGESINGRSHCVCGRELKAWENVPILGWLLSGGRARCCKARIPSHYFWAEVVSMLTWALLVKTLGPVVGFSARAVLRAAVTAFFTLRGKRQKAATSI